MSSQTNSPRLGGNCWSRDLKVRRLLRFAQVECRPSLVPPISMHLLSAAVEPPAISCRAHCLLGRIGRLWEWRAGWGYSPEADGAVPIRGEESFRPSFPPVVREVAKWSSTPRCRTPWICRVNMRSPFARSTGAPGFLQTQGQRAEADNAWPHPHGTVRATQQSGRTRQKPDGPSPK